MARNVFMCVVFSCVRNRGLRAARLGAVDFQVGERWQVVEQAWNWHLVAGESWCRVVATFGVEGLRDDKLASSVLRFSEASTQESAGMLSQALGLALSSVECVAGDNPTFAPRVNGDFDKCVWSLVTKTSVTERIVPYRTLCHPWPPSLLLRISCAVSLAKMRNPSGLPLSGLHSPADCHLRDKRLAAENEAWPVVAFAN